MEDKIYLNDSFEAFEKKLFGSYNYHQDSGFKTLEEWKDRNLGISTSLKLAIDQNLKLTDKLQKNEIMFQINLLIENIKESQNFDHLTNEIIIKLSKIIFLLLGDIPNNWNRKSKSLPKKWKLNKYRSLKYLITNRKKTLLIFKYIRETWNNNETVHVLHEKLTIEMDSNYIKFNEWFKTEYTDIYNELF